MFAARGSIPERLARPERKASLPDEFPDRTLPRSTSALIRIYSPPELPDELIDELIAGARTPEERSPAGTDCFSGVVPFAPANARGRDRRRRKKRFSEPRPRLS